MAVMRRGRWLDKQTFRKQHESALIVGACLAINSIIVAAFLWGYLCR
jgi:hypothetical protein